MNKLYKIMFFNILITGTIMAMSSYSWFSMWMGLEINMMSMIPLMLNPSNSMSTEASMKYFITQTMASLMIMMSIIMMFKMNLNNKPSIIMNSMLMMKLGAAPMHFWFTEVMEGINWSNCMIMLTIQKISPLTIMMNNKPPMNLMNMFIVSSLIISPLMALNQSSMRKLMTFSSINHMSWMFTLMMISSSTTIMYLIIYSLTTITSCIAMMKTNLLYMNQLNFLPKNLKFTLMMNFLSMGGLPPFIGFLPKWIAINKMISSSIYLMSIMLIMSSLMMMFVYLQLFFSSMMLNQTKKKTFMNKKYLTFYNNFFSIISMTSLIMFTILYNSF